MTLAIEAAQFTRSIPASIQRAVAMPFATSSPFPIKMQDSTLTGSSETSTAAHKNDRLSIPAILGIAIAITFAVIVIVLLSLYTSRMYRKTLVGAKRRTATHGELVTSEEKAEHLNPDEHRPELLRDANTVDSFDLEKCLPGLVKDNQLSNSGTIISDAGKAAKMSRMTSLRRVHGDKQRSMDLERIGDLQFWATDASCLDLESPFAYPLSDSAPCPARTSSVRHRPSNSEETTPSQPATI